jgi:fructose-specific component phosphotransferase system IIB-like protein
VRTVDRVRPPGETLVCPSMARGVRMARLFGGAAILAGLLTAFGGTALPHAGALTQSSPSGFSYGAGGRMAADPSKGFWTTNAAGRVRGHGGATSLGSLTPAQRTAPVVGMAATPDGQGYWLANSSGDVFSFGDAVDYGSTAGETLNQPIVAIAPTTDGDGYWLVGSDGGVFAFGDATFSGSMASTTLASPVDGITPTRDGAGYWLVATDGGVFAFGDATFTGSAVAARPHPHIVAMEPTPDAGGYWLVASNGRVFTYGDAENDGSLSGSHVRVSGMVVNPTRPSYTLVETNGSSATYSAPLSTGTPPSSAGNTGNTGNTGSSGNTGNTGAKATTTTTTTTTPITTSGAMAPPTGYSSSQLTFDDQFANLDNWNTFLGPGTRWDDEGALPAPYSAYNEQIGQEATEDEALYSPSQVSVDNGLTLTAQPNSNSYSNTWSWLSGCVTSKNPLPSGGWYVQVKAKMPDQSGGMWPAIWFLPSSSNQEFDGYEGGWLGSNPNEIMHSDIFAASGQQQDAYNVGTDVTAGYNVYGFKFVPGSPGSVTAYFNGKQVWQVNVDLADEAYYLFLQLQVAGSDTSSWHTTGGSTPQSMAVSEVQVYSNS